MNFINFPLAYDDRITSQEILRTRREKLGWHTSRLQKPPDCNFDNISVLKAENGTLKRRHSERHLQYALFLN